MSVFVTCTVFFHYIFMTNTLIAGVSTLTSRKANSGRPPRDRLSHILFLSAGLYTRNLKFRTFALANNII